MLVIACSEPCPVEHGIWLQHTWMGSVSWSRGRCTLGQSIRAEFRIKGEVLPLFRCSLGLFGLTQYLTSSCALGCFISLQEVWWVWDCYLHISEVSSWIYLPQTQSSSKMQSAGKRECTGNIYGKDGGKKLEGEKRQKLTGFRKKDFSSKFHIFFSAKPYFLDLLPKDFFLM